MRKDEIPEDMQLRIGMRQQDPFGDFAPVSAWKFRVLAPLGAIALIAACVLVYFKMKKGTSLYDHVRKALKKDEAVMKTFGEPIEFPKLYDARITGRTAEMNFDVTGKRRKGKCYVRAGKSYDMWNFDRSFCLVYNDADLKKLEFEITDYRASTWFPKKQWTNRRHESGYWWQKSDTGL